MTGRFFAFGDIHANAPALRAALDLVRRKGGGRIVLLGDLLTYGPDVAEVLELVRGATDEGASLLLGNHDQLYLDLLGGESPYFDSLPPWIRASAEWTLAQLDPELLRSLPFVTELVTDSMIFAHANPFGDWRYLNNTGDLRDAAASVYTMGLSVGVFGHTHRSCVNRVRPGSNLESACSWGVTWRPAARDEVLLVNAGSVGQPRHQNAISSMLEIEIDDHGVRPTIHELRYDVSAHLAATQGLPFDEETRRRLCSFFERRRETA